MTEAIYTPSAGENISHACAAATALANEHQAPVMFKFNDITLTANPGQPWREVETQFWRISEERREAYVASPRGVAAKLEQESRDRSNQIEIDALCIELPDALSSGLDATVAWLARYTLLADWSGVDNHADIVLSKLLAAGYVSNEFTGKDWVADNKTIMGRWIVGQCINCMSMGMPPHGLTVDFARKYRNML